MKLTRFFLLITFIISLLSLGTSCSRKESPEKKPTTKVTPSSPSGTETSQEKTTEKKPEKVCSYSTDPQEIKLQWTAYKFTNKFPVKGSFKIAKVSGLHSADSLANLAKGLKMEIDGASIESGSARRDTTIKDAFFANFNPPFKMTASVSQLQGNDTKGEVIIEIDMNGVKKSVPFSYNVDEEVGAVAKANINMMDFNLKVPFDSIHETCKTLHTGKDGVSKTWKEVDLEIIGKLKKECK